MSKRDNMNVTIVAFITLFALALSKSLPSQIPSTINKYELRRPLRFSYFRLNSKLELNPIIGHIAKAKNICSSKMGPFCEPINSEVIQEFQIMEEKLTEAERNAYLIQKYYQPTRFQIAQQIEKKTYNFFQVPSNEYKILDEVVKRSVKMQVHTEQENFYTQPKKESTANKK